MEDKNKNSKNKMIIEIGDKKEKKEEISNNKQNNEKKEEIKKIIPITKYSNLSPDLFSISYISEYKCICGLVPSPETANEIICCGNLICDKCIKKIISDKKQCPNSKSQEIKYRKIKNENKIFYKSFRTLNINCPYKCEWQGEWENLEIHLNECKNGVRYCKYKSIGCEFYDENQKVIEHEKNNDHNHLEMAINYIKINNIVKQNIKFKLGETCRTSVHPHIMIYTNGTAWKCDGGKLLIRCYSKSNKFNNGARFRCEECDFDLCNKCIVHYITN